MNPEPRTLNPNAMGGPRQMGEREQRHDSVLIDGSTDDKSSLIDVSDNDKTALTDGLTDGWSSADGGARTMPPRSTF